ESCSIYRASAKAALGAPEHARVQLEPLAVEARLGTGGDADPLGDDAPYRCLLLAPPRYRLVEIVRAEPRGHDDQPAGGLCRDDVERLQGRGELDTAGS